MIKSIYRSARQVGVDFRSISNARFLSKYIADTRIFKRMGGIIDSYYPILHDYSDISGVANGHYFHQDLLVSQFVFTAKPERHLDVASRVDGFVAHVASFRELDVLDIRPLPDSGHPNIRFVQADLMKPLPKFKGGYPSVSCLHALEHFGLGRYTDSINPDGHLIGFRAIGDLVALGGIFYISVPVGRSRVEFNAQRVFDPREIERWGVDEFHLERFDYVDDAGALHRLASPEDAIGLEFGCGIYTLRRKV